MNIRGIRKSVFILSIATCNLQTPLKLSSILKIYVASVLVYIRPFFLLVPSLHPPITKGLKGRKGEARCGMR